jgi:predicted HicB family RNase H-like nuclease
MSKSTKKIDVVDKYSYRVSWSADDNEHVGLCVEFPSLSWLARSQSGALGGIRKIVAAAIEDMKKNKETIPAPISERTFSGQFKVRIPPFLHQRLALEAQENHVSLNRLISAKLAVGR